MTAVLYRNLRAEIVELASDAGTPAGVGTPLGERQPWTMSLIRDTIEPSTLR